MELTIGFILDLIIGDPNNPVHPVRIIGRLCTILEKIMRNIFKNSLKLAGLIVWIITVAATFLVTFFIVYLARKVNLYFGIIVEGILIYFCISSKGLVVEGKKVISYLLKNDIIGARKQLSYIVGRDTERLNEVQITKAAVETVAENTSDGVIAPLFYIMIGGAPLGFFYKAVNTLDSMIGYKNDKYMYFGRFAARLDDVVNFIPAIAASYIMIFASFILKLDYKNAFKIYRRDRYNSSSPNCAKTESVTAGALQVQLLGDAYYFGKLVKKKTIGDDIRLIKIQDIITVNKLMYTTAIASLVIFSIIRWLGVNLL